MARQAKGAETAATSAEAIETLAQRHGTPAWALAGAMVHYGWGAGKTMTEKEYRGAIDGFLRSPIGGEVR